MLKFTKEISLAIDLVNVLSEAPIKISEAAEKLDVSHYNLQVVVRKLGNANVIKTVKGKGGGISRVDGDIKLKDLLLAFYEKPENTTTSNLPSSKLNHLYLSFLDVVSVYEEGEALSSMDNQKEEIQFNEAPTPSESFAKNNRLDRRLPEELIENLPEEELDFSDGW